jgi:phosphatidylglycerol lysyltransferase
VAPLLAAARALGTPLYDFAGLEAFKSKLRPERWDPIYLAYPPTMSPLRAVYESLRAFAPRGFVRFAWDALLRGSPIVLHGLSLALLPWMVLLAAARSPTWFPSPMAKWAWVVFDLFLFVALRAAARRIRPALDTILALAVSADAVITLGEAIAYNLRHGHGAATLPWIVIACAAPTVAAGLLWRVRARHRVALGLA